MQLRPGLALASLVGGEMRVAMSKNDEICDISGRWRTYLVVVAHRREHSAVAPTCGRTPARRHTSALLGADHRGDDLLESRARLGLDRAGRVQRGERAVAVQARLVACVGAGAGPLQDLDDLGRL